MALPKLPTSGLDDINQRRRRIETLNNVLDFSFDDSRVRTGAEITAGVTPVNYAYAPYNLLRYVADPTGVNACDRPFADWLAACDAANAEGVIPNGTYKITAQITFPLKVRCYGGSIIGAFNVLYTGR